MKSVNRGNAETGTVPAGSGVMPGMAGDGGSVPGGGEPAGGRDAARVPLRQLMDDRLPARCWTARGTRPAGCG